MTNDFPAIRLPSAIEAWKQTNFTQQFLIQAPGNKSLKWNNLNKIKAAVIKKIHLSHWTSLFFGVAKAASGNKGFSIDGFYVQGSTVCRTGPPPECSKSLLLRMQVNLGLREKSKMYWPHKKIRQPISNLIPFYSSAFSAKSLKLKSCCKSEFRKRLCFVCNNNKAFRTKNKNWQTVDEVRDSWNRWKHEQEK